LRYVLARARVVRVCVEGKCDSANGMGQICARGTCNSSMTCSDNIRACAEMSVCRCAHAHMVQPT
jgi:hypothetical protein